MLGKAWPKVAIILLNLNGYEDTRDCLTSLQALRYSDFEVMVVDNGSSDDSAARLKREFPGITLLVSKENTGFTGGNNLAIEQALTNGATYVLLLNNDTRVDPQFVTELVQTGESDLSIGILGPKIFYASEPQRIWYAGGKVRFARGSCDQAGKDTFEEDGKFSRTEDTGFVTGCAMMVKAAVFRKTGLLDTRLFMYWEDNDFCVRARRDGFRCVFVPSARVWHKVSRTSAANSAFTLFLSTRNQLIWIARYVPFPLKPVALAYTLFRKLVKAVLFIFKSRASAAAIWAGIWAFLSGTYGPPRKLAITPAGGKMRAQVVVDE